MICVRFGEQEAGFMVAEIEIVLRELKKKPNHYPCLSDLKTLLEHELEGRDGEETNIRGSHNSSGGAD